MHWPVGSLTSRPSLAHARQWRACSTSVMAPVCRFILCNRCIRPWPARRPDLFVLTEPVFHGRFPQDRVRRMERVFITGASSGIGRSEEHTSELQSRENLVCRLLPEKKKNCNGK